MSLMPLIAPITARYSFQNVTLQSTGGFGGTSQVKYLLTPDGARMFAQTDSSASIDYRDLGTAWDTSSGSGSTTISITPNAGSVSDGGRGIRFNADGSKVYIAFDDVIEEFSLSGAYQGTATYASTLSSTGSQRDFDFNADGTEIWTLESNNLYKRTLSSAYDLSSAGSKSASQLNLTTYATVEAFSFARDGTRLVFGAGPGSNDRVGMARLSTAYDASTASGYEFFSVEPLTGSTATVDAAFFGDNGSFAYAAQNGTLEQFNTVN